MFGGGEIGVRSLSEEADRTVTVESRCNAVVSCKEETKKRREISTSRKIQWHELNLISEFIIIFMKLYLLQNYHDKNILNIKMD